MFRIRIVDSNPAEYAKNPYNNNLDCTYESGQACAFAARQLNDIAHNTESSTRYKVERIESEESDSWKQRETSRFMRGEYEEIPWDRQIWYRDSIHCLNHFLHLSQKNKNRLAYTESAEKGIADKQTVIKPGRYLKKYFSNILSDSDIAMWSARVSTLGHCDGFKIAKTADDIERVYCNGPGSCMSHDAEDYRSRVHPVRVYGDSDISLAYLERDNSIPARCLIWEKEKIRSTIYGDGGVYHNELQRLLEEGGFTRDSFSGAMIQRIEDGDGFVLPYLDNVRGVNDHGNHLIISDCRCEYAADSVDGTSEEGMFCSNCNESIYEDDYYHSEHGNGPYCESCYSELYGHCEYCESETYRDDLQYVKSVGHAVCDDCISQHFVECEDCNEYFELDDTVSLEPDNEIVCHSCFESNHHSCSDCGDPYHKDNVTEHEDSGDMLCADCHETRIEDDKQLELDLESDRATSAGLAPPEPRAPV